jgi:PleD family two-component response regulator
MLRVLIIDDDAHHADFTADALRTSNAKLEIVHAATLDEATRLLRSSSFGCVIVDHVLQGGTGLDVLRLCEDKLLATPVIALSGARDPRVALDALRSGCVEFLAKQDVFHDPNLLQSKVAAAIMKHRRRAQALRDSVKPAVIESAAPQPAVKAPTAEQLLMRWHEQAQQHERWYTLAMLEIDRYDAYVASNAAAECEALARVVQDAIRQHLGPGETVCAAGAGRFFAFTQRVNATDIEQFVEKVSASFRDLRIPHQANSQAGRVTVSMGLASCCRKGESVKAALERALKALEKSLVNGGDRATVSLGPDSPAYSLAA